MPDQRHLHRVAAGRVTKKPVVRSKGFATREQRLPASPPLLNRTGPSSASPGFMVAMRARYRDALDLLFGTPPRVLNTACSAIPAPTSLINQENDHRPSEKQSQPITAKPRAYPKRTRQKPHFGPASPVLQNVKVAIPNDQVVPEGMVRVNPPVNKATPPVCSQSESCRCGEDLWTVGGVGPELMLRTAEELSAQIFRLYGKAVDPETSNVDYAALQSWDNFHDYLRSARKLRYLDPLLLSELERKAFFLNIYNSLMIHAIAVMSRPRTMFQRISLYNTAAYDIGGRAYTLNMIEHGVLRSNRPGSGPFAQPPFTDNDARKLCSLQSVDARIHFALNCGARSCPAVRFYAADTLDRTLDAATHVYLQEIEVDSDKCTITLPKLLQWYKADFSPDGELESVIRWTLPHLDSQKRDVISALLQDKRQRLGGYKVVYAGYDWTVNDSAL